MDDLSEQAWKEVIIDHGQFPRRHRRLKSCSHEGDGENPFCGDRVTLQLDLDSEGTIKDIAFEAKLSFLGSKQLSTIQDTFKSVF